MPAVQGTEDKVAYIFLVSPRHRALSSLGIHSVALEMRGFCPYAVCPYAKRSAMSDTSCAICDTKASRPSNVCSPRTLQRKSSAKGWP